MGRSRSNALQKSATPIPFPHDGPIHHGLLKHICSDSTPGITMASELLASESDSPSFRLCRALQSARSTKEQLQNFQSYRNSLLNTRNKGNEASSPLVEEDRTRPSSTNIIGLYRLLLEWSLSFMTPVPLQRAIQSTLKIMIQDIPDDDKFVIQSIQKDVLASLWKQPECWKNNLHSLEVAVNYAPLACLLQEALLPDCLSFLYQTKVARYLSGGPNEPLSNNQDVALGIVGILKVVLNSPRSTSDDHYRPLPFLRDLQQFVLRFLDYKNLPTDGIITLGIVYGMLLLHVGDANNIPLADIVVTAVETLDSVHSTLSPLSRLVMVQGIAATLDLPTLISTKSPSRSSISTCSSPLESCWRYSLKVSKEATDPMVRWGALKGLSTLAIRWQQQEQISIRCHDELIQETLQVVLQAWENPPLRKLGTAIPGLFKTLVKLLGVQQIDELCRHVIGQPVNRKGRYLALEILLPYMDASMISPLSLLDGIGDRGGNTGPIADLWSKLLGKFWKEHDAIPEASPQHNISVYVETWMSSWVPSLANALVAPKDLSRRKQVSAFCFPRIVDLMKSSDFLRPHLPNAFIALFDETASLRKKTNSKGALDSYSAESIGDRGLWAQLEVCNLFDTISKIVKV